MRSNYIFRPLVGTVLVLLVPFFMMVFSVEGWQWGPVDFVAMGILLFGAGFTYEYLASKTHTTGKKIAIGIVVFIALLAVWSELAVDAVSQLVQALFG